MIPSDEFRQSVRFIASKKMLFTPHAIQQMSRPSRMISVDEVRGVVASGEIIEDYPHDARGHSCLILGLGTGERPIHVVCAPKTEFLAIITAYLPDRAQWSADFKRRKI